MHQHTLIGRTHRVLDSTVRTVFHLDVSCIIISNEDALQDDSVDGSTPAVRAAQLKNKADLATRKPARARKPLRLCSLGLGDALKGPWAIL